jgi:hypothetical protein
VTARPALLLLFLLPLVAACGPGDATDTQADARVTFDAPATAAVDAPPPATFDAPGPTVHSCGAFSVGSEWTTATGFRSAVVRGGAPLVQPVALTFAGGAYGDRDVFVVDQGTQTLFRMSSLTGEPEVFVAPAQWPRAAALLTTVAWDPATGLHVGDQGSDGDGDSAIFRVPAAGAPTLFAAGPGAGLDDVYGIAFSPGGSYPEGVYVSGDTDGAGVGFGRIASGTTHTFAMFSGVEGLAVDTSGRFGGGLFAAMPSGGGYAGDDTISRILPNGAKDTPLASGLPGIHAIVFAPPGPFGGDAYAASWASGKIVRVTPAGEVSDLATGLALTNYDGNILAFSPDGNVLFVADRQRSRIVCIEAAPPE